jgi:hypothetical protein
MMKRIKSMLEIDRTSFHNYSTIQPPASVEDLRECQKALKEKQLPPIPQQYFAFLRNGCNGYWHRVEFYGTKPYRTKNSNLLIKDLVTANDRTRFTDLFIIGDGGFDKYYYNLKTKLYEAIWDGELQREYKTFADMFVYESIHGDSSFCD